MEFKYIKWQHGVEGYLDESETKNVEGMIYWLKKLNNMGKRISVMISIENGNQFHIFSEGHRITCYMTAEQCKYTIYGIYAAFALL